MDLQDRIQIFYSQVKITLIDELNESEVNNFIDYWTEHSLNAKKFRAEKEKVFDIKRRFNTWKRNQQKWFPEKQSKLQTFLKNYELGKNL